MSDTEDSLDEKIPFEICTLDVDDHYALLKEESDYTFFLDLLKSGDLYEFVNSIPDVKSYTVPAEFFTEHCTLLSTTFYITLSFCRAKYHTEIPKNFKDMWYYFCYTHTTTRH
jgi:hypothetical protein